MSRVQPLSVSELTANIKQLLEQSFSALRVRGEVSRFTRHGSGHLYFTIKDGGAALSAVVWRSTAGRLRCHPEEGGEFIFHGHLSLYAPRGSYQLVVSALSPVGEGELAALFERRKREWAARGWFDAARKRPLPQFPLHIGIVTSPTAAALEDVRRVLHNRPGWLRLTLAPALVQGESAAPSIADALERIMRVEPDLVLLVRGGGSMEDLWCFNDEQVVRAVVESPVPIVSGIGHEIDMTLTDMAADVRAATPSNAAELCSPDRYSLAMRVATTSRLYQLAAGAVASARCALADMELRHQRTVGAITDLRHHHTDRLLSTLSTCMGASLRLRGHALANLQRVLRAHEPHQQLRDRRQRWQELDGRLHQLPMRLQRLRQGCRTMALRMQCHLPKMAPRQRVVHDSVEALYSQMVQRYHQQRQRWLAADKTLHALDPHRVLERGFVMVKSEDGVMVTSSRGLAPPSRLLLRFADGTSRVEVVE
ncbi:MAG: exodeoxyribonuclease VII large subunit [Mariprofundales bacterium]|nr:exodeoxyribonuclease VII large subunit [Mariprofundales bacterium]